VYASPAQTNAWKNGYGNTINLSAYEFTTFADLYNYLNMQGIERGDPSNYSDGIVRDANQTD